MAKLHFFGTGIKLLQRNIFDFNIRKQKFLINYICVDRLPILRPKLLFIRQSKYSASIMPKLCFFKYQRQTSLGHNGLSVNIRIGLLQLQPKLFLIRYQKQTAALPLGKTIFCGSPESVPERGPDMFKMSSYSPKYDVKRRLWTLPQWNVLGTYSRRQVNKMSFYGIFSIVPNCNYLSGIVLIK